MIYICIGTRPEVIKLYTIIRELNNRHIPHKVFFSGQHKELYEDVKDLIPEPDISYGISKNDKLINKIFKISEFFYNEIETDELDNKNIVVVLGDTATSYACAMAAYHAKCKLVHIEAGLRSFNKNNPFPEEKYRVMIDHMADVHICPTENNMKNLSVEGIEKEVYVTGNSVIDALLENRSHSLTLNQVLITLHRGENLSYIKRIFNTIKSLANSYKDIEFIFPAHYNPKIQENLYVFEKENIKIIKPVGYKEFVKLMETSKLIITDSGGITEEAPSLGKKCIVIRRNTERGEALGKSSFLATSKIQIEEEFKRLINDYVYKGENPFGDGNSTRRIVNILEKL